MNDSSLGEELSPSIAEQHEELDAVLGSAIFQRSPSVLRMFEFIVRKYKQGETSDLKEYTIAVDALGRPATFNTKLDSIVRVEAYRVRKKLKEYYSTEGAEHKWEVVLDTGQYVPRFQKRGVTLIEEPARETPRPPVEPVSRKASTETEEPVSSRGRQRWAIAGVLGLVAIAALVFWSVGRERAAGIPATPVGNIRIAAASFGPVINQLGQVWEHDEFFSGGERRKLPLPDRTFDLALGILTDERVGDFDYIIPLEAPYNELQLYFAAGGSARTRRFRITANSRLLQNEKAPENTEASPGHVLIRVFKDIRPAGDGKLHLSFRSGEDRAFVSGIWIAPSERGRMNPVRIVMKPAPYTSPQGVVWGADRYEQGGTLVMRSLSTQGRFDPNLFTGERYGDFRYLIPVAPGRYRLNLYFAETWFGPGNPGGGGPGSRRFDVDINGMTVLNEFDILEAAAGPRIGIEKSFYDLTPDRSGYIAVTLRSRVNNACLNALELLDEGG
ncbi:MAG TPA: malectin domain-containing carbohydrate-binding protein [Bryobacteraceae bacterium]|nr:malectin domain-containing carbohydrate-binding protein [Bryobacteraceae bacterium]